MALVLLVQLAFIIICSPEAIKLLFRFFINHWQVKLSVLTNQPVSLLLQVAKTISLEIENSMFCTSSSDAVLLIYIHCSN
jgi:hypothetical protein